MAVRKAKSIPFHELESATPLQRLRWTMHKKQGRSIEDIATEHGCSPAVVRQSITRVEALMESFTLEEATRLQVEKVRAVHKAETKMLQEALGSEVVVVVNGKKVVQGPDYDTRLRAFEAMTSRLNAVQPRGGGVSVDLSKRDSHLHVDGGGVPHSSGKSFEDILRKVKAGQQKQIEAGPAADVILESAMLTDQDLEDSSALEGDDPPDDDE
jgi:hypothetical protein